MFEFAERPAQRSGHPRPTGPAPGGALHEAGRGHQSLHLQGEGDIQAVFRVRWEWAWKYTWK